MFCVALLYIGKVDMYSYACRWEIIAVSFIPLSFLDLWSIVCIVHLWVQTSVQSKDVKLRQERERGKFCSTATCTWNPRHSTIHLATCVHCVNVSMCVNWEFQIANRSMYTFKDKQYRSHYVVIYFKYHYCSKKILGY